jgi:succinate-semialdehyde dehydrogenase/glutarate-semialdehyde dehydrogenase
MAATLMLEQKEKFARLATLETEKRIGTSRGEVELSASILKYYADNTERFLARRPLNSIAGEATLVFAARGSSTGN